MPTQSCSSIKTSKSRFCRFALNAKFSNLRNSWGMLFHILAPSLESIFIEIVLEETKRGMTCDL